MNDTLKTAALLGKTAQIDGKMCVPASDPKLNALLKGCQVGEGLAIMDAWLRAWHASNLADRSWEDADHEAQLERIGRMRA